MGKEDIYAFTLEAPLQVKLTSSGFNFKNNNLFDGYTYKFVEADSLTEFPLILENNRYYGTQETNITYKLAVRKVFFDVHSILITRKTKPENNFQVYQLETNNKEFVIDISEFIIQSENSGIVLIDDKGKIILNDVLKNFSSKIHLDRNKLYKMIIGNFSQNDVETILNTFN